MRIHELDGLRATAALAVIAVHYFSWIRHSGAQYGWLGVDLFFVLSGFLITSILLDLKNRPSYFKTFYARRSLRIFPPYFFVLAVYLIYALSAHCAGTPAVWMKYVFYYQSLLLSDPWQYNMPEFCALGFLVLWSLSVEELFYVFWAPAVRFLRRSHFVTLLAIMVVAAPLFRLALRSYAPLQMYTFYCRMDGLALGAGVAVLSEARRHGFAACASSDAFFDRLCVALAWVFVCVAFIAGPDSIGGPAHGCARLVCGSVLRQRRLLHRASLRRRDELIASTALEASAQHRDGQLQSLSRPLAFAN